MWIVIRFFVSIVFASHFFLAGDALAQDAGARDANHEPTRIEIDSESGEILFYIEGELKAVLKSDGLHVRDDVQFGGSIFDSGADFHFSGVGSEKGDQDAAN